MLARIGRRFPGIPFKRRHCVQLYTALKELNPDARKLDGSGRSLRDVITMLDHLRARGVKFHSLTEAIDAPTPTGAPCGRQVIGTINQELILN